jgi:hypothetical protein
MMRGAVLGYRFQVRSTTPLLGVGLLAVLEAQDTSLSRGVFREVRKNLLAGSANGVEFAFSRGRHQRFKIRGSFI